MDIDQRRRTFADGIDELLEDEVVAAVASGIGRTLGEIPPALGEVLRLVLPEGFPLVTPAGFLGEADDFFITANVPEEPEADPREVGRTPIRGTGHVNDSVPSTTTGYEEEIEPYDCPVVGNEIGQYQIYPDYDEVRKYRGVLRARNLERFERSFAEPTEPFAITGRGRCVPCRRSDAEAVRHCSNQSPEEPLSVSHRLVSMTIPRIYVGPSAIDRHEGGPTRLMLQPYVRN